MTQTIAFDWLVGFTANISLFDEVNSKVSRDRETYPEHVSNYNYSDQDSDCKLHVLPLLLLISNYDN